MTANWIVLDVATAPLPNAAEYLDGTIKAPSTYKDPEKIADYIAEKQAERVQMAATDIDLARVIGVGWLDDAATTLTPSTRLASLPSAEPIMLELLADYLDRMKPTIVTFGGFAFDLPLLMRRSRYLGVNFPRLNLDRFKSAHIDLLQILSDRDPKRMRSLQFYVRRLGWTDLVKPLSGAEEARVPETGRWDDLAASLRHDVTATYRLACWLGVIQPVLTAEQEPVVG